MTKCSKPETHFGEYGECACVCARCYDRATKKCKCDECCLSPSPLVCVRERKQAST